MVKGGPMKEYKQTPEHKTKISKALKGRPSWKKGLTKEIDPRLVRKKNRK
jgi:hypothetical protein